MKSGLVVNGGQNVLLGINLIRTKMVHIIWEPSELYVTKSTGVHVEHSITLL